MKNNLAWDSVVASPSVIIAITDDGLSLTHADLATTLWSNVDEIAANGVDDDANGYIDDLVGWDFSGNDNNVAPVSSDAHGTHVAGIAAAATNNGIGVAGTAGGASVMPIRFYGTGAWTSTIVASSF
jgi:subtilisin family serine protease